MSDFFNPRHRDRTYAPDDNLGREQPDMRQTNKVSWFEMPADDLGRASSFYSNVFGWRTPPMGTEGAYALTTAADDSGNPTEVGAINGGIHRRANEADAGPVVNISVDDIDATLERIVAAGGRIIQPRSEVEEFGLSMALFADTEGNVLGIYTSGGA
ncbi:VOC family protein [Agromyces sp. CFH 90414]|uniref:VOC family protein n=1 Tax=Agromyces agglutinans TaxID=2662258 RepID=A0A6I2FDI8_9MICO|nr:VOC family protein [Agromyces agglutinans]MRG59158.1 VOC family protein [Agromyces agglutinans]